MSRSVEPVAKYRDEVLKEFEDPPTKCVTGADFLLEELEHHDPDPEERCGLLDNRFELYALRIANCAGLALLVSLNVSERKPWPCVVHGLAERRHHPCEIARRKAMRHFDLVDPIWEPADVRIQFQIRPSPPPP